MNSIGGVNNKWYISIKNKAKGPYTDLQMRDKIQSGELKREVLTYREGEPDWLPLEKQDIWTEGFVPKHPVETKDSRDWVLLVESPIKQGDYEQQGPFSHSEVEEKIQIGEVHLKDFCWRPGMAGWKSLVDTHELGFARKDKIEFEEDKKNNKKRENLVRTSALSKVPFEGVKALAEFPSLGSEMPDFVPPEDLVQDDTRRGLNIGFRARMLPPVIDKYGERKEVVSYLVLVAVLFIGAFYLGSNNSTDILKGVEGFGSGIVRLTQSILPATPRVSYVFLRELPLTEGTILVKTDGKQGIDIIAKLKDETGRFVRTKEGKLSVSLKTNKNGEAFLGLSQFKIESGKTYLVTTQVGRLTAKKTYFYSGT